MYQIQDNFTTGLLVSGEEAFYCPSEVVYRTHDMETQTSPRGSESSREAQPKQDIDYTGLYILFGIFVVLSIIGGLLVYFNKVP